MNSPAELASLGPGDQRGRPGDLRLRPGRADRQVDLRLPAPKDVPGIQAQIHRMIEDESTTNAIEKSRGSRPGHAPSVPHRIASRSNPYEGPIVSDVPWRGAVMTHSNDYAFGWPRARGDGPLPYHFEPGNSGRMIV
ncbi:hypothetical protein Aple_018430 [Acrocarpospora pleiomorpha]|uniref:Uncharacterized protein n=1 Tax=Acrocarpospora pleiomorpha TaxID=90975 RepID=A0A5M3XLE3_9ACTN|nr:hypothetical protein Aple_018430 [Acrocarpospora pleiomorpha]